VIARAPPTVAADTHSDVEALNRAFGCFPSGEVALCTSLDDGNPVGIAVSPFTSVSMEPPVSACSSHTSEAGPLNGPSPPTASRESRPPDHASNEPAIEGASPCRTNFATSHRRWRRLPQR
jgi:Flavin reductase like domain